MATVAELQAEIALLEAARNKALTGQRVSLQRGGMSIDRGDFATIQKILDAKRIELARLQAGSGGRPVSHSVAVFRGRR